MLREQGSATRLTHHIEVFEMFTKKTSVNSLSNYEASAFHDTFVTINEPLKITVNVWFPSKFHNYVSSFFHDYTDPRNSIFASIYPNG